MKRIAFLMLAASLLAIGIASDNYAQRGGRGGGGGGARPGGYGGGAGAGARPGGFTAPARPAATSAPAARSAPPTAGQLPTGGTRTSGTGPGGGSWQAGKGGGSYTTKGGSTIEYKGAAIGGSGAGGGTGGKYVGGVKVTTPGGQEFGKVSRGGAATGPGGVTVGGKGSISGTTGPAGSGAAVSRGGFASGPNGVVAGRSGVAVGPGGAAGYRGGVAVGPGGAVAGRTGVAVTPHGTYYRSAVAVRGQGVYVRAGTLPYRGCFTPAWIGRYPGAWFPGKWAAVTAWTAVTWAALSGSAGYPAESTGYDYGSSVVYQDNSVYVNGENVGTAEEYAQQATTIADAGKQAKASTEDEWMPLGVFAMVQGEETTSNNIFQMAVNKDGVIRGNYYNALTDTTEPVFGSVDKKTQRAAWTVGDKKTPVYEAGIVNMTKEDTTMMAHYSKDRSQQFTLFRIPQEDDGKAPAKDGQ